MKNLVNKTRAFLADETGAETVEWVMIAAALAAIIAIYYARGGGLGAALTSGFNKLTNAMQQSHHDD